MCEDEAKKTVQVSKILLFEETVGGFPVYKILISKIRWTNRNQFSSVLFNFESDYKYEAYSGNGN